LPAPASSRKRNFLELGGMPPGRRIRVSERKRRRALGLESDRKGLWLVSKRQQNMTDGASKNHVPLLRGIVVTPQNLTWKEKIRSSSKEREGEGVVRKEKNRGGSWWETGVRSLMATILTASSTGGRDTFFDLMRGGEKSSLHTRSSSNLRRCHSQPTNLSF